MGRLVVVTTPELAPGFRLAGVATEVVTSPAAAARVVADLVAAPETSVVAVHEPFLAAFDPEVREPLTMSLHPIVVALPAGTPAEGESRQERLAELLRRAVGYRITFGSGEK